MDAQYNKLIPIIIIVFILGVAVGYAVHKPEIQYINKTIEKTVVVTVTPTSTPTLTQTLTPTLSPTPTATPTVSDFTVKVYNPSTDMPTKTIEFVAGHAQPDSMSVRMDDIVLIKITSYPYQSPLTLILNNTYSKDLGTSGAVIVNFNNKGTYSFKGIISSDDPNILPLTYGEGTITVY